MSRTLLRFLRQSLFEVGDDVHSQQAQKLVSDAGKAVRQQGVRRVMQAVLVELGNARYLSLEGEAVGANTHQLALQMQSPR